MAGCSSSMLTDCMVSGSRVSMDLMSPQLWMPLLDSAAKASRMSPMCAIAASGDFKATPSRRIIELI